MVLWLENGGLVVECGGDTLSRYDVSLLREAGLKDVTNPRLFSIEHPSPQLKLFALDEALGEGGWLKAIDLYGYAARSRRKPGALRVALFLYVEAPCAIQAWPYPPPRTPVSRVAWWIA